MVNHGILMVVPGPNLLSLFVSVCVCLCGLKESKLNVDNKTFILQMITNTPFRIVLHAKTNKNRKVKRLFALQKHSRSVVLMGSAVGIIERERQPCRKRPRFNQTCIIQRFHEVRSF